MNFFSKMLISCFKATELMEKKIIVGLTFRERINLYVHTSVCDVCTKYQKQSKIIEKLLHRHICSHKEDNVKQVENNDLKKRIIEKL